MKLYRVDQIKSRGEFLTFKGLVQEDFLGRNFSSSMALDESPFLFLESRFAPDHRALVIDTDSIVLPERNPVIVSVRNETFAMQELVAIGISTREEINLWNKHAGLAPLKPNIPENAYELIASWHFLGSPKLTEHPKVRAFSTDDGYAPLIEAIYRTDIQRDEFIKLSKVDIDRVRERKISRKVLYSKDGLHLPDAKRISLHERLSERNHTRRGAISIPAITICSITDMPEGIINQAGYRTREAMNSSLEKENYGTIPPESLVSVYSLNGFTVE